MCVMYCGHTYLMYCHYTDCPTMSECIKFQGRERKINIPQEIGTKYYNFGIFLLEDVTGVQFSNSGCLNF